MKSPQFQSSSDSKALYIEVCILLLKLLIKLGRLFQPPLLGITDSPPQIKYEVICETECPQIGVVHSNSKIVGVILDAARFPYTLGWNENPSMSRAVRSKHRQYTLVMVNTKELPKNFAINLVQLYAVNVYHKINMFYHYQITMDVYRYIMYMPWKYFMSHGKY